MRVRECGERFEISSYLLSVICSILARSSILASASCNLTSSEERGGGD